MQEQARTKIGEKQQPSFRLYLFRGLPEGALLAMIILLEAKEYGIFPRTVRSFSEEEVAALHPQ